MMEIQGTRVTWPELDVSGWVGSAHFRLLKTEHFEILLSLSFSFGEVLFCFNSFIFSIFLLKDSWFTVLLSAAQQSDSVILAEMVGQHHWLNGHELEQTLGDGEGQGSLACCSPCYHRETWLSNWTTTKVPFVFWLLFQNNQLEVKMAEKFSS